MAKEKLESFKAGDTQKKASVRSPSKKAEPAAPESRSLGFRRIEGIIEKEDPARLSASLSKIHKDLEDFEKAAKSPKDKAAAKKARAAVERTADLMDYLFQTKAALQTQTGESK
jgi:hypothetical protein